MSSIKTNLKLPLISSRLKAKFALEDDTAELKNIG
jgi:hypothetical protein